jgi:formamidopyrimidine-DNA glycosylase
VVFRDGERRDRITYNDVRRFGFMDLLPQDEAWRHPHFAGLGVEPLGNDFHAGLLDRLFAGKAAPLKAALLDQRLIAGLGNIYVCEALHRAGLSPTRAAGSIAGPGKRQAQARDRLAAAIRDVLTEAVAAGGSSISDHARTDGSSAISSIRFRAYDREGGACPTPGLRRRYRAPHRAVRPLHLLLRRACQR